MIARVLSSFDRCEVRKGDMGRVSIVGGSRLYTGAPFYAARAAVRTGCDLVYIHCDSPSALPLKTLLPEAIVDPFDEVNKASPTWPWLSSETSKPHVGTFLIGCGLGKESFAREMICRLIRLRTLSGVNIIFDGDALRHSLTPDLLKWMIENPDNNYYLTPNDKEYQHLSLRKVHRAARTVCNVLVTCSIGLNAFAEPHLPVEEREGRHHLHHDNSLPGSCAVPGTGLEEAGGHGGRFGRHSGRGDLHDVRERKAAQNEPE
ncbi:putative ATP-dependent (S)-NAD(P)H-hydrate dehydratase [Gregarina niphandrodes]|uniref:ATP-dependent (S)-NAD(P)H-hydrate dehydratase n=1 Tax=Gregarina niphandrodes TaxID=110365 RepID=A0A023B320_GRENI|nr:putative ATP-dependent (S)-NAD(P)H-hydrate dehydratase [Gregarina niphandrodes]EZG55320.1 putative ATP-dependent (S)-NAD(P)H-hydrate dehydratase [Gregarina niphandrodes]|eukprot:XP_011131643.1 putative ATP-dependent (S)-NAD(P)H-hydrate dehydratase [Gregarina niphandrodes]